MDNTGTKTSASKPFYKKWWFWAITAFVFIGMAGATNQPNQSSQDVVDNTDSTVHASSIDKQDNTEETKQDTASSTSTSGDENKNTEDDNKKIKNITFNISSVSNDVTGKLRTSMINTPTKMMDIAVEYYNKFIKDSDEIHGIINRYDKTTTGIQNMGGMIWVRVFESVEAEANNAKNLFTGKLLEEKYFNAETGKEIVF